jgi:hypothetical protein
VQDVSDGHLLAQFVAVFPKGKRPYPFRRERAALEAFYAALPFGLSPLPPLYERLILSYKWGKPTPGGYDLRANEESCGGYSLHASFGGESLTPLLEAVRKDAGLWDALVPQRLFPFGRGGCQSYDPVCFDLSQRRNDGDCPVVGIDHEEILCNYRVKVVVELAPRFRDLVSNTITEARSVGAETNER